MAGDPSGETHDYGFGAPDVAALRRVRDRFHRHEPLVERAVIDSPANPRTVHVELSDGIEGNGRFDIRWSERGYYGFQYREPEVDLACRFDCHPKPGTPDAHFHPPPDASAAVEPSCIEVRLPELVALAVLEAWRYAYEQRTLEAINRIENPP